MTEMVMLEAALFQLRTAVATLEDDFYATQIRLAVNVLAGAIQNAGQSLTAAGVGEMEFALNDLTGLAGELPPPDSAAMEPALSMLRADLDRLKAETSLPPTVLQAIGAFQARLRARRAAIERETFRDPADPAQPLPHPPEALREEGLPLREHLASAGFSTPALDSLIADSASLRFHTINEIIDELDVVVG
jgi:hypothetical protein